MEQNENLDQNEQLQMVVEELNAKHPIDTIGCKQFAWGAMRGNWLSGALQIPLVKKIKWLWGYDAFFILHYFILARGL